MSDYDQLYWEQLWAKTLGAHPDQVAKRPPNPYLLEYAAGLSPGRALDAGCGHGAETLWLATHGWQVTAVDFSASALAQGRSMAEALGPDLAKRIAWVEGDLAVWDVPPDRFDLVSCLYVHVAGSVEALVQRMASGVKVGGTLLMAGHRLLDPATAGQTQVSVERAVAALDPRAFVFSVAEERPAQRGRGVDAVLCARRLT